MCAVLKLWYTCSHPLTRVCAVLKLWYTCSHPVTPEWKDQYSVGYITPEMCVERLFHSGPDSLALLCGPPPMLEHCCLPSLKKMGYPDDAIISF
jgi:NAD(P)H-flavin reductase